MVELLATPCPGSPFITNTSSIGYEIWDVLTSVGLISFRFARSSNVQFFPVH